MNAPDIRPETTQLRILLVEDDPGDVRLVRELLADAHAASRIQLNVVDSLTSAQRELGTGAFDAVLVDLGLRDTQGLETVRRLRSIDGDTPIVVLTGNPDSEFGLRVLQAGAQDSLPIGRITGEVLLRVLRYGIERQRHERRQTFLADVGAALASSLDYATTLQHVADLAVPRVADLCLVDVMLGRHTIQRVGVAGRGSLDESWAARSRGEFEVPRKALYGVPRVLQTGCPELVADLQGCSLELLFPLIPSNGTSDPAAILASMRPRSRIITPLVARGSVIGCVTLLRTGLSNENYTSADLAFAQQLADRAALAVDNARLFRDAQQALRVRQDVLRFVSHDLKNPLTSLRMQTEILQELIQEGAKDDCPAEVHERIVYGLKHMDTLTLSMWGLVNELLDVSQMQSGQQLRLKRSEVDLVALVGASIAEYQLPDGSIGLRTSEPALVGRWDEARLGRVVDNLLSNAVKYSPGGGSIQVSIERAGTGDMVRLLVEDHGMGIPAADLPRVFDLFFRSSNVPARLRGTGLGLAGARQIVEQHGGYIRIDSAEGHGTRVTVELPLG